ncbi:xylulokinase [Gynuella sp.]|uniref:xylulokinase n=1 Tax=Gynuella sp. TaxID=2969146 RepID=UPI003D13E083
MYLGFDLGTSALKAVLINNSGEVIDQQSHAYPVSQPKPLWSEQNPEDWWQAIQAVTHQLGRAHDLSNLRAMGIAGQMHGATLLDNHGQVLRPCILWNDGRSFQECEDLMREHADFCERSGNLAMPGFTAPKLVWVARHEPEVFKQLAKVLLPKDYLVWRLTGVYASDMSDAAGTLWLNPAKRDWDDQLLAATGLNRTHMPELFEGNQIVGHLNADIAKELGLPEIPVVAGAGDNAAGAVGVGIVDAGDAFLSLGTSGVLFVASSAHHANPENTVHAFCHCLPDRWHQMAVSLSAANCLSWFSGLVDKEVPTLLQELEDSGIDQTQVIFLPYLSGERTPHNDPMASACFFGATNATTRAELTLAILEGVAFSFADGRDALLSAGTLFKQISLIGGGARSGRWRQIIADVLNQPLVFRDGGEVGPGLGAARLAHLAIEPERLESICRAPEVLAHHQPDPEKQHYYQNRLSKYRQLYQITQHLNRE